MNIPPQDQNIISPLSCTPDHKLPGPEINLCFTLLGKTHQIAHIKKKNQRKNSNKTKTHSKTQTRKCNVLVSNLIEVNIISFL